MKNFFLGKVRLVISAKRNSVTVRELGARQDMATVPQGPEITAAMTEVFFFFFLFFLQSRTVLGHGDKRSRQQELRRIGHRKRYGDSFTRIGADSCRGRRRL